MRTINLLSTLGRPPKATTACRQPVPRGRRAVLVLALLLTSLVLSIDVHADINPGDPGYATISHPMTMEEPWLGIDLVAFDKSDGWDNKAAFKDKVDIYINSEYFCSPNYQLAVYDGTNFQAMANALTNYNGKQYGQTYTKRVGLNEFTIAFWSPRRGNNDNYIITMCIYPKYIGVYASSSFSCSIKGSWKRKYKDVINCDKEIATCDFQPQFEDFEIFRTTYGKFEIKGALPSLKGTINDLGVTYSTQINGEIKSEKKELPRESTSYRFTDLDCPEDCIFGWANVIIAFQIKNNLGLFTSVSTYLTPKYIPLRKHPVRISAKFNMWDKQVNLSWDKVPDDGSRPRGTLSIYCYPKGSKNERKLIVEGLPIETTSYPCDVSQYEKDYTFEVTLVPEGTPEGVIIDRTTSSVDCSSKRRFDIKMDDINISDNYLEVNWKSEPFLGLGQLTYTVYRQSSEEDTWTELPHKVTVNDSKQTSFSYKDTSLPSSCASYRYKVEGTLPEVSNFVSKSDSTRFMKPTGQSMVTSLTATKGDYQGVVKLSWTADQIDSTPTQFELLRKSKGSDTWATITKVSGTSKNYYYEDNTAQSGQYYDYRVVSTTPCGTEESVVDAFDEGFCRSTGIVSGRISYGTGTAVKNARVQLVKNNDSGEDKSQFYALKTEGVGDGVYLDLDGKTLNERFGQTKPFTIQLMVRPQAQQKGSKPVFFDLGGKLSLVLGQYTETGYPLLVTHDNQTDTTTIKLHANAYTSVTIAYGAPGYLYFTAIDSLDSVQTVAIAQNTTIAFADSLKNGLCFGGAYQSTVDNQFVGYIDEMRVFSGKALTKEEVMRNYNHTLSGTEEMLYAYWPVDEGIGDQKIAYDYSKTSGVANGNHGRLGFQTTSTNEFVPTPNQLGLFAYTDSVGNFVVRGVPFNGDGTNYMVVPTMGIHEFSPAYSSCYVSASSLVHSGVNFTDVSSFPVKGAVYYKGTNYPVEGCNFYVDGEICSKDGQIITSSSNGEFTISVPIGDHFIEVKKEGHVFSQNGRYPADPNGTGERLTFNEPVRNLFFSDTTLVNFSGRVVGGSIEGNKPLGFGESVNNIGVTKIVLTPTQPKYSLNGKYEIIGTTFEWKDNDSIVVCESANKAIINSKSWRGAGNNINQIYVFTDSKTGEFSALVPPLNYKVDSMIVESSKLQLGGVGVVNLTNPRLVYTDSTETADGEKLEYQYNYSLKHTYHSAPTFKVTERGHGDGAFGLTSYSSKDIEGEFTIDSLYTIKADSTIDYKYGGAIFVSEDKYTFDIEAFEEYLNKDEGANNNPYKVPLANTEVVISNALSSEQSVYIEGNKDNKDPGTVATMVDNTLTLDADGKATYVWKAGLPNITAPYSRTISMSYDIDGRIYNWKENGLNGVILGSLPTGSNFVTAGPDIVEMILRDPPGSLSSAQWTSGTITSRSTSSGDVWDSENEILTQTKIGPEMKTAVGIGVAAISEVKTVADVDAGVLVKTEGENASTWSRSVTATRTISTSAEPDYVGHNGDVFIGTATNLVYGLARDVNFRRDSVAKDSFALGLKDIYTTGLDFKTSFNYTVNYIENTLLPNLEAIRNRLLETVTTIEGHPRPEGKKPIYLTILSPGDTGFGSYNHDSKIWDNAAKRGTDGPSYWMITPEGIDDPTDSVAWCNNQIEIWKGWLAKNELEKVEAHNNYAKTLLQNISFDAGTTINATTQIDTITGSTYECTVTGQAILGVASGASFNKVGVIGSIRTVTGGGTHDTSSEEETKSAAFSYTLAESGSDDALSVDVYQYGDYSPIFRTRAGQTSDPYEGEVTTKYLDSVKVIMEATMQIEVPQIAVDNPTVINVPSGSPANYILRLSNASEIDTDVYYKLFQIDDKNENGAMLTIDGLPLSMNRLIKIPAGETVTKALQLRQTDLRQLTFENLGIVLASQTQWDPTGVWDQIADTVYVSAQFTPSSSPVVISLDKTTINTKTGTDLNISFSEFDRNFANLKAFRLQYCKQGDTGWTQLYEYVLNAEDPMQNRQILPKDSATVTYRFPMAEYSDGTYRFRIQSVSNFGTEEVYRYSDEIAVIKDTESPQPLGQPMPANGILGAGDDLGITFNEPILKGELTKTANFLVTGVLNGSTVEHETALELRHNVVAAATEAPVTLSNRNFSIDTWLYLDSVGTLFSHGNGAMKFEVAVTPQQQLAVTIGANTYTSVNALPMDKWFYLTTSYMYGTQPLLNASFATNGDEKVLFQDFPVCAYKGQGTLTVGNGATGAIHELTLWDEAHDFATALANKEKTKYPATPHLVGYWKLNEGQGTTATDYARNRHMKLTAETWRLDNENLAASLDGTSHLDILTGSVAPLAEDNCALELWMCADKQEGEAQLLQSGEVELWIDTAGKLRLSTLDNEYALGENILLDNVWHHVALNILRTGHASVYVDGKRVLTTSASNIGQTASDRLIIGARRTHGTETQYTYERFFKGFVDDIRLWNATLTADLLKTRAKIRLTGEEEGLVAYYPFETKTLDQNLQVVTKGTAEDLVNGANKAVYESGEGLQFVDNAPALRKAPTETNVDFSYTASDDKIIITIGEDPATIEGCTLNFTVRGVRDMNGNTSTPVCWSAYINRNELTWNKPSIELRKRVNDTADFEASFTNKGGSQQTWSISGLPLWLMTTTEDGTADPLCETAVTFTVAPDTPIGSYEESVYLSGNDNMVSPLTVKLTVTGDVPTWSVDPTAYESTMNLIGTLSILGEPSNDTEDMIAVFIDGECRGVTHPVYNARYDNYFVMLDIYGNNDDAGKAVAFYAYDNSTGVSYPELSTSQPVGFKANQVVGTYANPVILNAEDLIEQSLFFNKGWNWSSFFVRTEDMSVSRFFEPVANQTEVVKSKTAFATFENGTYFGKVFDLDNRSMYKVRMAQPASLRVVGHRPTDQERSIVVRPGWNWIAYSATRTASVGDALVALDPMDGDLIKGQQGFAMFDGYEWNGSLKAMVPGQGYMFQSTATSERILDYPLQSAPFTAAPLALSQLRIFTPTDHHKYPSNMCLVAYVTWDGMPASGHEVGVFADEECRTAEMVDAEGYAYFTIPGDGQQTFRFLMEQNGKVFVSDVTVSYEEDAVIGSHNMPFSVPFLSESGAYIDACHAALGDDELWFTLSGQRLSGKPTIKGVYVRRVYNKETKSITTQNVTVK